MAESIEFRLKVIEDKLGVALDQNEKKAKSLGTTLQVALGTFAGTAITKGISLVGDGFRNLAGFVSESVSAAAESEAALKRLEVALSQTGKLSEENVKAFQDFATQIQATTSYEDDLVISNIALIQSLARLDSEGLKKATEAALNLSSALGIDLETASRIVGKAAEGNTTALGKLGIEFKKGATDAETFSNVLATIESRFGGAAQAQAQTFAGTIAQLSNIWGDLKENVGAAITQNPAVIAAFGVLRDIIISFSKSITEAFGQGNQDQIANLFRLTLDSINAVVLTLDALGRGFVATVEISLAAIRGLALGIVTPAAGVLELLALIPGIGESFKGAADAATNEMLRLSEAFDKNVSGFYEAVSGETFLSSVSQQIADARVNFDVLYNDIKTKQTDLKNNPVTIVDPEESEKLRTLNAELLAIENEYYLAANQLDEQNRVAELERFATRSAEDIASLQQFELDKSELAYQSAVARAEASLKGEELGVAKQKALREKELRDLNINAKTKEELRKKEIQDQQAFFASASSLASSSNKTLAAIGKASALTEIAINTQRSASSSFAFGSKIGGPALGATFAAIAVAAGTAQAAKVAGIQGFANGGIIGQGATLGGDNRLATVRDGEMVLDAQQQKNLFSMINNGGNAGGNIVIQIDGRNIAYAVRDQINQGFKLT